MTDAAILVLLAVRLRSRASASAIETTFVLLGGDESSFAGLLSAAEGLGQVRVRGDDPRRWSLTGAGEAELAAHLIAESERVGRADLTTAYEAFLPMNRAFLASLASSAAGEPSADFLDDAIDDLGPVLAALEAALPRFAAYRDRFDVARRRASAAPEYVTSPSVDSVHTIWFELHEHLLATLGRHRTQESSTE